jgi:acyl-CoA thioester hydrolase
MTEINPPEGYRHHTPVMIRYGDMDTLGHVNNAKYLTYIEQSRLGYFGDLMQWDGSRSGVGLILAKVTVEYKAPLTVADGMVNVWTRTSRIGTKSFDMEHLVIRAKDGLVAAAGFTVMVAYNYAESATVALPDEWRQRISAYEPAL